MSDDIADLFAPPPEGMGQNIKVVQGTVTTFNPADGSNTVRVVNTTLTNVPMLQSGAEIAFFAGDAVLLLVVGTTYMIIGKVAVPGTDSYAATSSVPQANSGASASNFAIPAGQNNYARASISVPSWADTAAVSCWSTGVVHSSNDQDVLIGANLNGQLVDYITFFGASGHTVSSHTGGCLTVSINPGTTQLYVDAWLNPGTAIPASAANFMLANISATFYRSNGQSFAYTV